MVDKAVKEQILQDLEQLPPELQRRAQELVHGLVSSPPRGTPLEDLLDLVGTLDKDSAREMIEAIEEDCERVDLDAW